MVASYISTNNVLLLNLNNSRFPGISSIASMAASSLQHFTPSTFSSIFKTKTHHSTPSYKPTKIPMSQNQTSWASINTAVDSHINQALSGRQPSSVYDPMHHLIFTIPKTMAPALCIAACEALGGGHHQALPAASALHLMHVATYTHEHLQLTDIPTAVRPAAHHGLGTNIELLTADSMIPFGYELLAAMEDPEDDDSASRVLRVMIEMGRAMGAQGVVAEQYKKTLKGIDHEKVLEKGGVLYACGAACGAVLGGGDDEEIEKMRRYGLYVGMIHGIMGVDQSEERLLKLAESLRFLAVKELEGLKDRNVEGVYGIMDGYHILARVEGLGISSSWSSKLCCIKSQS